MHKRFFVAMTLALAISACDSEGSSSTTTSTADTSSGADSAGGDASSSSDTAGSDTTTADTASSDAATTDTATADTASTDTATTDTASTTATFDKASAVLSAKCATCHIGVPKAKFDGKDCATVAALANTIKGEISKGAMPPKGSPTLSADEKAAILDWIAAGAACK